VAAPTADKPKMATDIPAAITTQDRVETRIGALKFFDGLPDKDTVEKVYDHLDFMRGVEVFLNTVSGASLVAMRHGMRHVGAVDGTIGIEKGKPFASDARMKKILTDAAAVANATARQLDARIIMLYYGTGITPAMTAKMVGAGSQYAYIERDAQGNYLDGSKTYKLHLPPNISVKNFWSLVLYDSQTRSTLQADAQFPSVGSQQPDIQKNADGLVDATSARRRPWARKATVCRVCPARAGTPSSASTARSSRGSTRAGVRVRLKR
jgi:hypothetical protein